VKRTATSQSGDTSTVPTFLEEFVCQPEG